MGSGYLSIDDLPTTDFGNEQPFVVSMTCASGQFGLPGTPCLGEELMLKQGRAAIAVWSASGLSIGFQAHQLDLALAEVLASQPSGTRLGDTLRRSVETFLDRGGDPVSPAIYNLLGDPGLPLHYTVRPLALSARLDPGGLRIDLTGTPGKTYRVEAAGEIGAAVWESVGQIGTDATGGAGITQSLSGGSDRRYYRAVLVP
jgi:hypothetical protein